MPQSGPLRDNRDFRRYWIGRAASDLGTQMSVVAFPLLVLAMDGSAAQAGAVASASLVARTACRLVAGHLVDHADRRLIMFRCDLIRAVALASIPLAAFAGVLTYPHLFVVAVVEGVATAFFSPAALVAVRQLVPLEQLTAALARSQARLAAASLLGPALGGWLFSLHRLMPFAGDAVSYLVSALCVSRIQTPLSAARPSGSKNRNLLAGLRWLAGDRTLRAVLAFAGLLNLVTTAALLAVTLTLRQAGHSGVAVGLVLACVGGGSVLGAMLAPRLIGLLRPGSLLVLLSGAWTASLLVFAVAASPWVDAVLLVATFLLSPSAGVLVGQMLLTEAPAELQGRVTTAADLLMSGLSALGPLIAGVALGVVGPRRTWLLLAMLAALAAAAAARLPRPSAVATPPSPESSRPDYRSKPTPA